ncbi:MAG: hypothetical protein HOW73_24025 [Polyangiaceae bacterium]|nr:hypothetical protein [Polyangiaceae bacterium]
MAVVVVDLAGKDVVLSHASTEPQGAMAIEFVEGGRLVCVLSQRVFDQLDSTLKELERLSGLIVDPCKTTLLSPEHAKIWMRSLRRFVANDAVSPSVRVGVQVLMGALQGALRERRTLLLEGD